MSATIVIATCTECGRRVTVLDGKFVTHGKLSSNGAFVACPGSAKHVQRNKAVIESDTDTEYIDITESHS